MQALILAAGMGSRLKEITNDKPKCMVLVNGKTIIERMLEQLDCLGLSRIVIVIGYSGSVLIDYIASLNINTPVVYVWNEEYHRTNNIYSLYLARGYMGDEDSLLLESDLVFEPAVLERLIEEKGVNLALVARYENWMDGTVVTIDGDGSISDIIGKEEFVYNSGFRYYKTVNIYKICSEFSSKHFFPMMESHMEKNGKSDYYEKVLKHMIKEDEFTMRAVLLKSEKWYEIDNPCDLSVANTIFGDEPEETV